MRKFLILVGAVAMASISAFAGEGLVQTPKSMAVEAAKLSKVTKGKAIRCVNKQGQETFSLAIVSKNGKDTLKASSTYGDGGAESTIAQLSSGDLIMAYVTGPDSDEGGAVIIMNSAYLDRDGETNANAQLFSGIPGDDEFYDRSEALKCSLK